MSFSLAQQKALAIIPKITGLTSVFCSIFIVVTVLRDKEKRRKTYHRLLAGISLVDISSSFSVSMSTWPIPKDSGVLWAVGNDTTCRMQGFFNQFTVCSSFYNVSLSIYYLLVVRYGWKQHRIRRIEPALHAVPFLWGAVTAISGLPLDIYGNSFLWCFISAENDAYRWGFFYAPLWLMILIVTVNCVLIFKFVRKTEQAVSRHDFASQRMRRMASNASSGRDRNTANLEQSSRDFGASASTIDFAASARTIEFGPTPENGVPEKEASVAVPESVSEEGRRSTRLSLRRQQSNPLSKRTREVAIQSLFYAGAFYLNWFALTVRIFYELKWHN